MVRHGLSDCGYVIGGSFCSLPGAVSIELSPKLTAVQSGRIASNGEAIRYQDIGYDGRLELADVPAGFLRDVLGYVIDDDGTVTERYRNGEPAVFALLYQVKGIAERRVLCCCTATKPEIKTHTDAKGIEYQTVSIGIYARRNGTGDISKHTSNTISTAYTSWFGYRT